jgi:diaminopimelate decarboxylase
LRTGSPSSKHGIWFEDLQPVLLSAGQANMLVVALHAHVGTGPQPGEFETNMRRLVDVFAELVSDLRDVSAVNLGGGIPHPYRPGDPALDLSAFSEILVGARHELSQRAGRPIRLEIEPGRYAVAGMAIPSPAET